MEIHGIPISSVWGLIKYLPSAILRRMFPGQRLANLIQVDLRPRHDSATVNFGECASFEIWINVTNLSPFEVELDRAAFQFYFGAGGISSSILKRQIVRPGEVFSTCIASTIPDGQANQMARTHSLNLDMKGWLEGHVDFNCKLHSFSKSIRGLDGIAPRILNKEFRVVTLEQ